jgi:oligopeptide/dipeptide ABC transporter ATP-binding protein
MGGAVKVLGATKEPLQASNGQSDHKRVGSLAVDDLTVTFDVTGGRLEAVRGVSFAASFGETVAIVGESGSGKSATVRAVMGLTERVGGHAGGSVVLDGKDILQLSDRELRRVRGKDVALIFQDPGRALDPSLRIGVQVAETVRAHFAVTKHEAFEAAVEALRLVRLPTPEKQMGFYPDELSGGMRQRVCIAMAMVCRPGVLIADEATTALDVTTEGEIMRVLLDIRSRLGMLLLMVTHNLSLAAAHADRVIVMYAGRIVEEAPAKQVFETPRMPYTRALLECSPEYAMERGESVTSLPGQPPSPLERHVGCPFRPRCPRAQGRCTAEEPPLVEVAAGHRVACWFPL